ncbi:hypothetical protein U1Q18_002543, partial [Sarracenia purpurea var. burkii]
NVEARQMKDATTDKNKYKCKTNNNATLSVHLDANPSPAYRKSVFAPAAQPNDPNA